MKPLKLQRTFFEGWKNFVRNGWLSFATVSVLVFSLYVISATVLLGFITNSFFDGVGQKINISVYFNDEVSESRIQELQAQLANAREVASVEYISKESAVEQLRKNSGEGDIIQRSLDVIGANPIPDALVIRAHNPQDYEIIEAQLKKSVYAQDIASMNYGKYKALIERYDRVMNAMQKIGLALGLSFLFISVLITYNAIRLTLYSYRKEFEIMRLVGASNLYIKMPFVFEGIFYGIFAAITTLILLFLTAQFITPLLQLAELGGTIERFFFAHFFIIAPALFVIGILLGVMSSWIAIKRYLSI